MTPLTRRGLRRVPIRAIAALTLLPVLGLTPAAAQAAGPTSVVTPADRGKPAPATDCATAKPAKGRIECVRPSTPDEVDPGAVAATRADLASQAAAAPATTAPDGSATANITTPPPVELPPTYCPVDGFFYQGRKGACQIYNFTHEVLLDGRPIGLATFTVTEWSTLSHLSRSWNHQVAIRQNTGTNVTSTGMFVYLYPNCTPVASCSTSTPINSTWLPIRTTYRAVAVQTSADHPVDYSNQNTSIRTLSLAGGVAAQGYTLLFDRIRCDQTAYVNNSQGCVWSNMPGYFELSLSGPAADSARWVAEAQRTLVTHPGLFGQGYGLHRATPTQNDANRAISGAACVPLRLTAPDKDCDEYPFAAVVEGAAFGAKGVTWDIQMVVSADNQRAGSQLATFYSQQRMWWGDHFYVVVTP